MSTTEGASARYADIENWSTRELVDGIVESQFTAIAAVAAASASIARAIDATAGFTFRQHGRDQARAAADLGLLAQRLEPADLRQPHSPHEPR